MLPEEDRMRLLHIQEASAKAIRFLGDRSQEAMAEEEQLTLALVRLIEIVGEAAKNVSEETRRLAPTVSWRSICGMRDRLAHAYFDVDLGLVWDAVHNEMPSLLEEVNILLTEDDTS